jgi:predicted secreted Zn-dependent protease
MTAPKISRFAAALAAFLICSLALRNASAEPAVSYVTKGYDIWGTTSAELRAQMNKHGPRGNWAYTDWYVTWTPNCRVSLRITFTFPHWINQNDATNALRVEWTHMLTNLQTHEQGHAQHGRNAAAEVEASGCHGNPKSITDKWARQDKVYDDQTDHGRTQGVALP